ncbi:hypothetical protein [Zunongwangia sp.]|uniref:hypothetical protein n=1 Tax=Zunongwangia sp. TaxID=1965325 RepID=UPI003AA83AA6
MLYNSKIDPYLEVFDNKAKYLPKEDLEGSMMNLLRIPFYICFVVKNAQKARISAINAGIKELSKDTLTIALSNINKQ